MNPLDSLLREIYSPLKDKKIAATYQGKHHPERDVWSVENSTMNTILHQILEDMKKRDYDGSRLYDVVWKGIVEKSHNEHDLYVYAHPPGVQVGKTYNFQVKGIDVWKASMYGNKAGVNIILDLM